MNWRDFAPPILMRWIRRLRHRPPEPLWELAPGGFPETTAPSGWALPRVAAAELGRWTQCLEAIRAPRPLAMAHEVPDPSVPMCWAQLHWMSLLYVVGQARPPQGPLRLLDWGGGLGHTAAVLREAMPALHVDYHLHDFPAFIEVAKNLLPDAKLHDDPESALAGSYDLVMASGSIHYARDWQALLARMAGCTRTDLYLTRVPTTTAEQGYVFSQQTGIGYDMACHAWCLPAGQIVAHLDTLGFELRREFLCDEIAPVRGAPQPAIYRGWWFRRRSPV